MSVALLCAGTAYFARAAHAEPRLHLSWDTCSSALLSRSLSPGETSLTAVVSASGWDVEHRGFRVVFLVRGDAPFGADCVSSFPTVPDAWRFDDGGCEGRAAALFSFTSGEPASCPSLVGGGPGTTFAATTDHDPLPASSIDAVRFVATASYPTRAAVDPAQRFELVRIRFDLTKALPGPGGGPILCDGIDRAVTLIRTYPAGSPGGPCLRSDVHSSWTDAGGNLQLLPWDSLEGLRFEGPAVPAIARTWGAIKNQYR